MISPTGVQAVHPDGEIAVARAAAAAGTAMGLSSFASKAIEDVVQAGPPVFFQVYWMGRERMIQLIERARAAGAAGADRHAGLDVLPPPRLGQPGDPRTTRPAHDGERSRPRRSPVRGGCGVTFAAARSPTSRRPTCRARRGGADVLRRLRRVDADAAAELVGRRLAARAVGRAVRRQGGHAPRRRQARRRHRRRRDLGLEPRRQQPRRHTGVDPGAARRRRRGRRPRRGPARRRHPPRQRRRQGARPRRPGRPHRTRLPLGHGRQRRDRRQQRAGDPAQRDRRDARRTRTRIDPRSHPPRPDRSSGLRRGRSCSRGEAATDAPAQPLPPRHGSPPHERLARRRHLARRRARRGGAVLAVPIGSTEQHGPHLPLSTDTDIAVALAGALAHARPTVVVAPALPYGSSGEHEGFAGTLSIGQEALELALVELCRSASATFAADPAHQRARRQRRAARPSAAAPTRRGPATSARGSPSWAGDAHAGRTETSLMLALAPEQRTAATRPVRATSRRSPSSCRGCAPAACERSARTACSATPPAPRRRGPRASRRGDEELVAMVDAWERGA